METHNGININNMKQDGNMSFVNIDIVLLKPYGSNMIKTNRSIVMRIVPCVFKYCQIVLQLTNSSK